MNKWLVWLFLLTLAILLIAAGLQGRLGSLIAVFFTPASLDDAVTQAQTSPPSSSPIVIL